MTIGNADNAQRKLAEQRQELRQQLQQQRARIAQQIASIRAAHTEFPRSMTMRFLLQRPALVTLLTAEMTALLLSARLVKILNATLILTRILVAIRKDRISLSRLKPTPNSPNDAS